MIACPPLFAALTPTSLTGRVTSAGEPLAGATVTLTSPALQHERTTTTNSRGRYFFTALPPGRYDAAFSKSGYTSLIRSSVIELGRVARADATLDKSEDEETVTSTATNVNVTETTAVTTHFSEGELDRLPLRFDRLSAYVLAPGAFLGEVLVDDAPFAGFPGFEGVEELTVFRAGAPPELTGSSLGVVSARTRSGSEQFTLSVRDTFAKIGDQGGHLLESASGGRIVPERLWFFASGWGGDLFSLDDVHGLQFKLTAQPGAAHNVVASYRHSESNVEQSTTSLHYTGIFGDRFTAQAAVHDIEQQTLFGVDARTGAAKLSYVFGDHVVSGGADHFSSAFGDFTAFFLGDRWSAGRFTIDASARHDEFDSFSPRLAATYDLRGDGRHAIVASFIEQNVDTATLGYVTALGNSGLARIDYVRRSTSAIDVDELQAEARYRLFDRLEAGGTYTWAEGYNPGSPSHTHTGHAWLGAELPLGSHEIGATLLENYQAEEWSTDASLRYSVPFSRVRLTLGAEVVNAFADEVFLQPRTWRLWVRVRH